MLVYNIDGNICTRSNATTFTIEHIYNADVKWVLAWSPTPIL